MFKISSTVILTIVLFTQPLSVLASDTNNMFGTWGSVDLQGDFTSLSSDLGNFNWQIINQTRSRDDSSDGSRFTENILFSHLGYQVNKNISLRLGYVHNWINPLNKPSFQESRPYQDFVWKQSLGNFKFMSRTRMDERIHLTTGDIAYRPRQLLQIRHSLPFVNGLSIYAGDEVLFYINKNNFGKQGFSENRIFSGLSYKFTTHTRLDLGYMGQYIDTVSAKNIFTHNVQANISYKF